MIKEFYYNRRWLLWAWGGALVLLGSLYAQVYMSVLFNEWYGRFYNLFQPPHGTIPQFWGEFGWFIKIAAVYIGLALWTGWFTRVYAFRWRKALTFRYISRWRSVKEEIEGASQRIQQDTERFARIMETLGLQVVRAIMTLIAFVPILWKLSENIIIKIVNWTVPIIGTLEGNLVWTAIFTTIVGMGVSWFVGYYLPGLEYKNQKVEAAFRKDLVLGEDDKIHYALPKTLARLFFGLEHNYHRLFLHYGYFDLWYNLYDQAMTILPYVVVGPSVVLGVVPLGVLIQVSNAFGKVHGSMSLFIQNWTVITELRSIWKRLREFEINIKKYNIHIDQNIFKEKENQLYKYDFGPGMAKESIDKIMKIYYWPMGKIVKWVTTYEKLSLELLFSIPIIGLIITFLYLVSEILKR